MRRKRVLALCMSILLCFTLLPLQAFAEEAAPVEREEILTTEPLGPGPDEENGNAASGPEHDDEEPVSAEETFSFDENVDTEDLASNVTAVEQLPLEYAPEEELLENEQAESDFLPDAVPYDGIPEDETINEESVSAESVEETVEDETASEDARTAEDLTSSEERAPTEGNSKEVLQEAERIFETEEEQTETEAMEKAETLEVLDLEQWRPTGEIPLPAGNEELLEGYITEFLYGDVVPDGMGPGLAKKNFGAALTGKEANLYRELVKLIGDVAAGRRSSTLFRIPASTIIGVNSLSVEDCNNGALEIDINRVISVIFADCPYEQYWMDYGRGLYGWNEVWQYGNTVDLSNGFFEWQCYVSPYYSVGRKTDTCEFDLSFIASVNSAAANAKSIVSQASGKSDLDKMRFYGDRICALNTYNETARDYGPNYNGYGYNPWQIVWVFDGDPGTNVVCEGYAKAFQYLCDLTSFDREIACYCLNGLWVQLDTGDNGLHAWNAVTLDNGRNYLVDLTHSDAGNHMEDWAWFLAADTEPEKGNPTDGYYFTRTDGTRVHYGYDEQCYMRSTEDARTITTVPLSQYLECPILKGGTSVGNSSYRISWTSVPDADCYQVMRWDTAAGSWASLAETKDTVYTDSTPEAGVEYLYTVFAWKGSISSGYDKNYLDFTWFHDSVKLISATGIEGGIQLKWEPGTAAVKYRIYRKASGDKEWSLLADTNSTNYTDESVTVGTEYSYMVRSLSAGGRVISGQDDIGVRAICTMPKMLPTPKISGVNNIKDGVKVKWKAVSGARQYRVLRKTGSGSWKKVADTVELTWTDQTVKSGKTYSYTVQCVSADGTQITSRYHTTGKSITFIAAPKIKSVQNVRTGVAVKWAKVAGAEKYRVFRKGPSDSKWVKLGDTAKTGFTDKTAKNGKRYRYAVRCVKEDGSAVTGALSSAKSITFVNAPVIGNASTVKGKVTLKWKKINGATKYNVYRKGPGESNWVKIESTKKLTYTDKTGQAGVKYTYALKAYNGAAKTWSSFSSGKSIRAK